MNKLSFKLKPVILCFIPNYLPGYKSGGPVISLSNLVNALKNYIDFYIVTSDRDLNDKKAYKDIIVNIWNKLFSSNIYYLSKKNLPAQLVFY